MMGTAFRNLVIVPFPTRTHDLDQPKARVEVNCEGANPPAADQLQQRSREGNWTFVARLFRTTTMLVFSSNHRVIFTLR